MGEITLVVTKDVLVEVFVKYNHYEKQIALRKASDDIIPLLVGINRDNRKTIILGNSIRLILGNNHAIWREHNDKHLEDFDDIFHLLSRRPDIEFRCLCQIEEII